MRDRERSRFGGIPLWLIPVLVLGLGCGGGQASPTVASPAAATVIASVPPDTPPTADLLLIEGPATDDATGRGVLATLRRNDAGAWTGSWEPAGEDSAVVHVALRLAGGERVGELDRVFDPVVSRTLVPAGGSDLSLAVEHWAWPADGESAPLYLRVSVPSSTPSGESVWISGNLPSLGSWNGAGVELVDHPRGDRVTRLHLPLGSNLEFKFTRGSWNTVEKGPSGEEISNRRHTITGPDTLDLRVEAWRDQVGPVDPQHTLTGTIRYHRSMPSAFLAPVRDVIVYLPPDYETATDRRYPVLYMHDGQNVFDAATSFAGEWGADETAQRLIEAEELDPLIIVGIYNAGAARIDEYTQVRDEGRGAGGNADAYGRFLVEELKPFIDATYRTRPEREHTGLAGSSLGGLVTQYLGITHADVFSRLGVISPSVWWGGRHILGVVAAAPKTDTRIWVDIGTAEAGSPQESRRMVEDTRALRDALIARGWVLGDDLGYLEDEGANHNEAAWRGRFEAILKFLFPRP